jgi:hypothetical protein
MTKLWARHLILLMPSVIFLTTRVPAVAQGETTSAIVGTVTDQTGAAIPGATVTVVSTENGLKRSVKSDDSGRFSFPQLKPGMYLLNAQADRFEAQNRNVQPASGKSKRSNSS